MFSIGNVGNNIHKYMKMRGNAVMEFLRRRFLGCSWIRSCVLLCVREGNKKVISIRMYPSLMTPLPPLSSRFLFIKTRDWALQKSKEMHTYKYKG
jgi:hypothetical protein